MENGATLNIRRMGWLTRVGIALCVWFAAVRPHDAAAQPAPNDTIVVAGLRPAAEGYAATEIIRLAHAQKIRELVDEAVHEITQRVVLNHGALRAALGQRYLVEFFGCEGALKCVVRTFGKVKGQATHLVYGDYSVKKRTYRIRMRLVEMASGKMVSEVEFTLDAKEIEDAATWKQKLKALLAVIAPAGETGGGETGGGETGGGETGGGETGGGETGGGETGGSGHGSDELTDADFGEAVEQVTVEPPKPREDLPWLTVASIAGATSRWFDFETLDEDSDVLRPPGFTSDWTTKLGGSAELFPFLLLKRHGLLSRIGFAGEYARSDISPAGGRETSMYAGTRFMIPIGSTASYPTFGLSAGFLRHDFVIVDEMVTFPSVSYRGARVGASARVPIGTPRVALFSDVRYMWGVPKGALFLVEQYGAARIGGFDVDSFLEIRPLGAVFVRIGARYTRFSLEFDGDGDLSDNGSVGAQDKYLTATVSTGLVL
jgi:hypothetical protein